MPSNVAKKSSSGSNPSNRSIPSSYRKYSSTKDTEASASQKPPSKQVKTALKAPRLLKESTVKGLPEDKSLEHPTEYEEEDDLQPDFPGEFTDDLSDLTDKDDVQQDTHTTRATTWFRRLQPLVQNKRVRIYTGINLFLLVVNFSLFICLIVYAGVTLKMGFEARSYLKGERPCMYQFSKWSACSNSCTKNGIQNYKTRHVIPESIVIARGRFASQSPCPANLETLKETAPYNTHACPVKLSSFEYVECWPVNASNPASSCYSILDIPRDDTAILVDTKNITKECNCLNSTTSPSI